MQRSVLNFGLATSILGCLLINGIKSAIAATETTVVVPANSMCTDSGIDVRAGESIDFQAGGRASYGHEGSPVNDTPKTDADGNRYSQGRQIPKKDDTNAIYPKAIGSLVGKVGTNGNYFYVGATNQITFSRSGRLFLCYNDVQGQFGNNSGSYRVVLSSTATAITQPSPQRDNETLNQKREYQDFAGDFCVNRSRDCINVSVAANLSLNIAYKDNQANQEAAFKQALKEYADILGETLNEDPKVSAFYAELGRIDANVGGRVLLGVISTQKNNHRKERYVIAFRGTDITPNNLIESLLNVSSDSNGVSQSSKTKFHPGFKEHTFGLNRNLVQLQSLITGEIYLANKNGQQDDVEVMITGHSLGGASAEIYAATLIDQLKDRGINRFSNVHVITFGAPPAIKENFVGEYAGIPAIRIEKSGDIVADLTTNGSSNDAYRLLDNMHGIAQVVIGSQAKTIIQQFRDGHYRSFAKTRIISDKSARMRAAQRELQAYDDLNPILKAGVNLDSSALLELEQARRGVFNEGISAHLSYGEYYDLVFNNPALKSRLKSQYSGQNLSRF